VWLDSLARRARESCAARIPSLGVQRVTLGGTGDQVDVEVTTARRGTLRMTGRATFDEPTGRIRVTALQDAPGSRPGGISSSDRQALRRALEESLQEDVSEQIDGALEPLGHAMNRPINGEVRMSGGINKRRLLGIGVENGALVAHWAVGGRAWIHLR
jgi:hypothetical protein